jgi:hypothetical protein
MTITLVISLQVKKMTFALNANNMKQVMNGQVHGFNVTNVMVGCTCK